MGDDLAMLLARVFLGVTWRVLRRSRAGRVPASYPTTSTRRLMSPVADARTDPKVYADCHEDCRNYRKEYRFVEEGCQEDVAKALFQSFLDWQMQYGIRH